MSPEFSLIEKYFRRAVTDANTDLGIGDDAALIQVSAGHQLVVSTDMSVAGIHFFLNAQAFDIGWKSLAVNVSDMAAMGAKPRWATLALALPEANEAWLKDFAEGFFACADAFNIALIGGDTTHGPLNISVTIMGEVAIGQALLRSAAQEGDDIWVSGVLGKAAMGLQFILEALELTSLEQETCLQALHRPQPRVQLGLALSSLAHSCIDVSDGLLADLNHILQASKLGADIYLEDIASLPTMVHRLHEPLLQQAILAGGDDYELCFTAPVKNREAILALSDRLGLPLSRIGTTTTSPSLNVFYQNKPLAINHLGYDHFA
jgi:thiamine-monophosphate kinase